MQVSGVGANAVYAAAMRSPQAKINPEVNGQQMQAAAKAQAAMYDLAGAMGSTASVQSAALSSLSDSVDVMA